MEQYIHSFDIFDACGHYQDPVPDIQDFIDDGWTVKLITPITGKEDNSSPTVAVLVLFERETKKD